MGPHVIKLFMSFEPRPQRSRDDLPISESQRPSHQHLFRPGRFTHEAFTQRRVCSIPGPFLHLTVAPDSNLYRHVCTRGGYQ